MSIVSVDSIEAAIKKIDGLSDDALDKLIETFAAKQDDLLGHVMQAGVEYENEDLNAFSIYYFTIIVEAFLIEKLSLKTIDQDDIEAFQEPFLLALDEINKEEDYTALHELINQPNLISFMVNEIDSEDEDGESLEEETKTQLFIVMSSMIGLLNSAIQK
ncbi:hypothetical protein DNU06_08460 [Putridiphycobacter roseus]|uniref:Uncharacterized protein n=1 Tax=Putridiphycobacter roseus TaxID=2219161 RepID=A0A2W1NDV8_9FLAO|nr:hypothetical protein [Putridiphycobacter roseus]PZE17293.1 hypothetical protein DNU06_08460 [Putridiphycobacter roseus]